MNMEKRAVFIDRDGVICEAIDRGDNCFVAGKKVRFTAPWRYNEFRLLPGVEAALKRLGELGFVRLLVTNQPDVAYGAMAQEDYDRIVAEVKKLPLDDIFTCLHTRFDGCDCKKPKPGMLLAAAAKWKIDMTSSFMIGDEESDMAAGRAVGCVTLLIDYPRNQESASDHRVKTLIEAVALIGSLSKI